MQKWNDEMNEKKKDVKKKEKKEDKGSSSSTDVIKWWKEIKRCERKKRRIKTPDPDHQLRNYEAGHTYGGLKMHRFFFTSDCSYYMYNVHTLNIYIHLVAT